ncbi:Oligosaccharide translocation protein RFT1 [Pseudocercospora fuligena]|uniref:Man(5)GlcNAc(2)-PP-dolichol translocation protein RFT1 n=1 Tax=Pseudocercospora fuligena TaxID=685502 RepID=A0A8H6RU25_9PEZI|nr:Oligosaccharide translocation protein RFT1 [Pseudocercospora fuligena]
MAQDAVSSSARGAIFLILQQVASRAVTFIFNQVLLRFLSPALLGASVQLELYIISAHHFARESLRVACQRQPEGGIQAAINLSYLAIASGIPIVIGLAQWYLSTSYPDVPYFTEALRICELAAIVELFSEPAFVAVQQNMMYKTRAAAESSAVIVKTAATAAIVFWSRYAAVELGVLPFAAGELAYCSALTVVYLWQTASVARQQKFTLLPKKIEIKKSDTDFVLGLFSRSLFNLSLSLYVQQGIKYVLTQGDVLVSTALATLEEQGMYALSANYGGLVARMVFRPIEDSSRNLFAQLCAPGPEKESSDAPDKKTATSTKPSQPKANIEQAKTTLDLILHSYSIASLLAFALGPTAAPLLLQIVAGSRWSASGAGEVLGIYCYCIPLLAINGVSEAFVAATASTKELHWQSIWMGAFSAGFAASAYVFLRVLEMGAKGLVWANCVNMALRIVFNLYFVKSFFQRHDLQYSIGDITPSMYATAGAVVVPGLLKQTAGILSRYGIIGELVRVGAIGTGLVLFIAVTERQFLLDCWRRARL